MKAQTLSINMHVPCDAQCPFCIARLTYKTGVNNNVRLLRALPRAIKFATLHQIDTVLVTGIGEPTANQDDLTDILMALRDSPIPIVEMQTNGYNLWKDHSYLSVLRNKGLNTLAISACSMDPVKSAEIMKLGNGRGDYLYTDLISDAANMGFLVRLSLNMVCDDYWGDIDTWAKTLKSLGLHQLTLREIGEPSEMGKENERILDWIRTNKASAAQIAGLRTIIEKPDRLLRRLDYGASVYDYHGLSTSIVTCYTDNTNPDEIRSVILQPDGHCYHSWNFKGSSLW